MHKTIYKLVISVIFTILISGCQKEDIALPSVSAVPISSPTESLTPISAPAASPLDTVKKLLTADLTQAEAELHWGSNHYNVETGTYTNGEFIASDVWRYDEAPSTYTHKWNDTEEMIDFAGLASGSVNAQLQLNWSKQGQLLYAIYYYRGVDGKLFSYLPAIGALQASSSESNTLAKQNKLQLGQTIQVNKGTYTYDLISSKTPKTLFPLEQGKSYQLTALTDQFAELNDQGYHGWVPVWYLTDEAAHIEPISPQKLTVQTNTPAYWYPGAGRPAIELKPGQIVYAFEQFAGWYSIVPVPEKGSDPLGAIWIKKDNLQSQGILSDLYSHKSDATVEMIAAAAKSLFQQSSSQKVVRAVFGEPGFLETSENIIPTGKPMKTLEVWRYENASSQLIITWAADHTLYKYEFIKHTESEPATKNQPFEWRFHSDLAFNYLVGTADNMLLVAGDDGGFSGMHYDSDLYAVDQKTGDRLWTHKAGFEGHNFVLSADQKRIVFITRDTTNTMDNSIYRLEGHNMATGKQEWIRDLNNGGTLWEFNYIGAANTIALAYTKVKDTDKQSFIEAFDIYTGKSLWKKQLKEPGILIGQQLSSKLILVQSNLDNPLLSELSAYNPLNGRKVWTIQERIAMNMYERPFTDDIRHLSGDGLTAIWTQSVDELILVDLATGKDIKRLPLSPLIRYIAINERYAFELKSRDGKGVRQSTDVASTLLDLKTGKALWTVNGKALAGVIEANTLFYNLDGTINAVELASGKIRWKSSFPSIGAIVMFDGKLVVESTPSVLVLDPSSGKVQYRMSDVKTGYYDFTPPLLINGTLTVLAGKLYVGSANGYFRRIDKLE